MANPEVLAILLKGAVTWNAWLSGRHDPGDLDLREADLAGRDLSNLQLVNVDLTGANLQDATLTSTRILQSNLPRASLKRASLEDAILAGVDLAEADLQDSSLVDARLEGVVLSRANLTSAVLNHAVFTNCRARGAQFSGARFLWTVLADMDLTDARGLDACVHGGPSVLGHVTLERSERLPLKFLRGCGLSDTFIEYLPPLRSLAPIRFYSCFISYSGADQAFADRLHADLQNNGVRCWFAPHDMQPGRKILEQIDEAIRVYDRLVLILSNESMSSPWVKVEINKARKKERQQSRSVLFPIRLVPFSDVRTWEQFNADFGEDIAQEIREYHIPDFSTWKADHDSYTKSFEALLKALKSADSAPAGSA